MNAGALIPRQSIVALLLLLLASSAAAFEDSQTAPGDSLEHVYAVTVYPDGGFDWDYILTNFPYITFVRDRM